jgi:hypothetical protein
MILRLYSAIIDLPLDDGYAKIMARAPIKYGGSGLRPVWGIRQAAYLAGFAAAHKEILRDSSIDDDIPSLTEARAAFSAILPYVTGLPWFPREFSSFVNLIRTEPDRISGLQRALTLAVEAAAIGAELSKSTPQQQAVPRSCAGRYASRWKTVHPRSPILTLNDNEYQWASAASLQIPLQCLDHKQCACSAVLSAQSAILHTSVCKIATGALSIRHNDLRGVIEDACSDAQVPCRAETLCFVDPHSDEMIQADLVVQVPSASSTGVTAIDFAVTTPGTVSSISQHSDSVSGATASHAEAAKLDKYARFAHARNVTIIPFVVEAFGTLGKHALAFIDSLGKSFARAHPSESSSVFVSFLLSRVSVTLARGISRCIALTIVKCLEREGTSCT